MVEVSFRASGYSRRQYLDNAEKMDRARYRSLSGICVYAVCGNTMAVFQAEHRAVVTRDISRCGGHREISTYLFPASRLHRRRNYVPEAREFSANAAHCDHADDEDRSALSGFAVAAWTFGADCDEGLPGASAGDRHKNARGPVACNTIEHASRRNDPGQFGGGSC